MSLINEVKAWFNGLHPKGGLISALWVKLAGVETSPFNELLVTDRETQLDIRSTWGISDLRDLFFEDGAVIREASIPTAKVTLEKGQIVLFSGTNSEQVRAIETIERGQYLPGTQLDAGIGLRFDDVKDDGSDLGPGQSIEWGYFNDKDGMGFGINSDIGFYLFYEKNNTVTKIPRSDWDDPLDGTGPSKINFSLVDGAVFKNLFTHYGFGPLQYQIIADSGNDKTPVEVYRKSFKGEINLIDPNQPLQLRTTNGVSGSVNKKIFLAGRQVSIWGSLEVPRFRTYEQGFKNVTATSTTDWEPIIAIRKKSLLNGKSNSVNVILSSFEYFTDNDAELSMTVREDGSDLTFRVPDRVLDEETSVEVQVANDGSAAPLTSTLTGALNGIQVLYDLSQGAKNTSRPGEKNDTIPISQYYTIILWARKLTANDANISGYIVWSEQR